MAQLLRTVIILCFIALMVWTLLPPAMSAYYGGDPPPHLARILDRQSETLHDSALKVFTFFENVGRFPGFIGPAIALRDRGRRVQADHGSLGIPGAGRRHRRAAGADA